MTPDQKSRQQEKLDAAVAWLRQNGNYALEVPYQVRIYKPLNGYPLEPRK